MIAYAQIPSLLRYLLGVLLSCLGLLLAGSRAEAETRVTEVTLSGVFDAAGRHTPKWYQYDIDTIHPTGCGPVAWSILYSYWQRFHGRPALFNNPNAILLGAEDPEIIGATDTIARFTETSFGMAGSRPPTRPLAKPGVRPTIRRARAARPNAIAAPATPP